MVGVAHLVKTGTEEGGKSTASEASEFEHETKKRS